jgi:nucleotide-binding universal stress UspA family protein
MSSESSGVLVLLDGSETAERALDRAIELAARDGLPVTCLAVIPPRLWRAKQGQFQMSPEKHDEEFAQELSRAGRDRCIKHGVDAGTRVRSGAPARIVVEEAANGYAHVVLGERPSLTGAPTLASIVRGRIAATLDVVV